MSRTLFWYIFLDLLRIFGLASGVLSGIMSFGGLLRPLYEFGLSMPQVAKILAYSGPAMTAYSLPIAALFATTIVYGRFGADNEITACRAAGISHTAMSMPAFVLGLVTAFASVGLLCFAVPASMYKVEQVIFSNLADLVASQIERSHQINIDQGGDSGQITIHAESANVLPYDPAHPNLQAVQLIGPEVVTFEKAERGRPVVPREFYFASSAIAYIDRPGDTDVANVTIDLTNIIKFPRWPISTSERAGSEFSVGSQKIGPKAMESPIKENTKFMNIFRLQDVLNHPEQSQRVRNSLAELIRRDQQEAYMKMLADRLNSAGSVELDGLSETYVAKRGPTSQPAQIVKGRLVVSGDPTTAPVQLIQTRGPQSLISVDAAQMEIEPNPDIEHQRINLSIDMIDATVKVRDSTAPPRHDLPRPITVAMPPEILALKDRSFDQYMNSTISPEDKQRLQRESIKLINSVISEMHARMSFALSCLILVMVGCALGMMFRSGNFLSAFAVSVIPALLSIALVVTGQHTCENVPPTLTLHWQNPLNLGLMIIWSGNAAVLIIAAVLLTRLHRQ